eukprot:Skav213177  [mRNA]  locus=scaffold11:199640:209363:- [translate_table: standard]
MKDNHWEGRDHGHGWESNKSLLSHGFIERDKAGKSWRTNWRGPKDQIRLTQVLLADKTLNRAALLVYWRQVSKDRRRFLHGHIDMLNNQDLGYQLSHASRGAGRHRVLIVKKMPAMAATRPMPMDLGPTIDLPGPSTSSAACSTGPGHKLGGRRSTQGKREAFAMAAELRIKKPRLSQPSVSLAQSRSERNTAAKQDDSSSSSSSSDSQNVGDSGAEELDEEMRRVMEISLRDANRDTPRGSQDEDRDLQEAVRLSLESASSQDAQDLPANPSPGRFARLSASRSMAPIELDDSQEVNASKAEPPLLASSSRTVAELKACLRDMGWKVLSVDLRERRSDSSPRDIYEEPLPALTFLQHHSDRFFLLSFTWLTPCRCRA